MKSGRKESNYLSELIKSLNPKEKRYINIFFAQYKEENNKYLKLFKSLSATGKLEDVNKSENNLSVLKVQLYWKILNVLQVFHSENHALIKKNNLISQYLILSEKGLYEHALRVLKTAKKLCIENDFEEDLIYIIKEEVNIMLQKNEGNIREDIIAEFNKSNLIYLKVIKQKYLLNKLYFQNKINFYYNSTFLNDKAYAISNSYSINLKSKDILSDLAMVINYYNAGMYYLAAKRQARCFTVFLKALDVCINKNKIISSHISYFYELLQMICFTFIHFNKINQFKKWVNQIRTVLINKNIYNGITEVIFSSYLCEVYIQENNIDKFKLEVEKLNNLKLEINSLKHSFIIDYFTIKFYLLNNNLIQVFKLLNNFFNNYSKDYKPDYQLPLRLLYIILSFLTKDYAFLNIEVKKMAYFYKKSDHNSDFFESILNDLIVYCKSKDALPTVSDKNKFLKNLGNNMKTKDYKINYENYINFNTLIK